MIKKLQKALGRIRYIPKTDHKSYLLIFIELLVWVISNGGGVNTYFDYKLFLKGKKPGDYLKPKDFHKIEKELNSPEYFPLLEDKYFFYKILEGTTLRGPKNLYLIDYSGIYKLDSNEYVDEEEFLRHEFEGFCKVINGFGGRMIYLLEVSDGSLKLNKKDILVPDFLNFLGKTKYLIQEGIVQHQAMNELNPSCVNTLRILTIRTGQTINFYKVYLRVGMNNSYVDNQLSGNLSVGVDSETGKLFEYALDLNSPPYPNQIERHPQTNTVFKDFQIPFYEECIEMTKSLHKLYQQFFMIGWDIGITPDGPIVIEGNNITDLFPYQLLYGGQKSSFEELAEAYRLNPTSG